MITDRTAQEVELGRTLRKKIQAGHTLSAAEIATLQRVSCTASMLNRIENKQAELRELLDTESYFSGITNKTWGNSANNDRTDFRLTEYTRILENCKKLKDAFTKYPSTPDTPTYLYGWQEANAVEKILVDIEALIAELKENYRKCGTFQCGGDTL